MEARRNSDLRRRNVLDVLTILRDGGRMSRADLSARTTLSPQALANILHDLVESGTVVEVELRGNHRSRGRPARLYEYAAHRTTMVSVYVGLRYCELQFCDAIGQPVLDNQELFPGWDPDTIVDEVGARITASLDQLATEPDRCVTAIVVHGTVDPGNGVANSTPMNWTGVPIAPRLAERIGADVTVHDASRAAAIAEYREGAARGSRRSVVFNVGPEVAATLVENGRLQTGSANLAGQLGGTLIPLDGVIRPLDELIGSVAIKRRYTELSGNHVDWVTEVHRRALDGDPIAQSMIDRTSVGVAFAASWLIAVHAPERLVITGAVGDWRARGRLVDRVVERCDPRFLEHTSIEVSHLGRQAWTRGGIHAAIDRHRELEAAAI